jgi:hypothetical protein
MAEIELKDSERQECEVWTRVMGYHRPLESFNRGKKSEFYARKCFTEEKAVSHLSCSEKPNSCQEKLDNSLAAE